MFQKSMIKLHVYFKECTFVNLIMSKNIQVSVPLEGWHAILAIQVKDEGMKSKLCLTLK